MKQFEYGVSDYKLICALADGEISIIGARGSGSSIEIPEEIEYNGSPYVVTSIEKKTFLGLSALREVVLPKSVKNIGDWAFAQCARLTNVCIPFETEIGVGVFDGCPCLLQICIEKEEEDFSLDLSILLATCVTKLPSEDLLRDVELGSAHWYQKWDQRLLNFLNEDDKEGYQTMVLCGEEDIRKDVPEYIFEKQMDKCSLCMIRLLYNEGIEKDTSKAYIDYILSHIKGCESDAAWKVIMRDYSDRLVFYDLLADIGGITKDNVDAMIEDLDSQYAEARAYLIRYKQEHFAKEDVFSMFDL